MAVFVFRTYSIDGSTAASVLDYIANFFFFLRWLLFLWLSPVGRKARYVTSLDSAIDVFTFTNFVLPTFFLRTNIGLGFPRVVRVYRAFLQLNPSAERSSNNTGRHLARIALGSSAFILVFASTVFLLENAGNPPFLEPYNNEDEFTMYNSMYFAVVSLSTVGYGDFSPTTFFSRLLTIIFLIVGIGLFSSAVSELISILSSEARGEGSFSNTLGKRVVLVSGDIPASVLKEWLTEFWHPDHASRTRNLHVVILAEDRWYHTDTHKWLSSHLLYRSAVTYLKGTVFRVEDLRRAGALGEGIAAAFLLTHKFRRDDEANVLRTIAFRRFVPGVPCYVVLNERRSRQHVLSAGIPFSNILPLNTLKLGLMAQNVTTPGSATLVLNLFSSSAALESSLPPPPPFLSNTDKVAIIMAGRGLVAFGSEPASVMSQGSQRATAQPEPVSHSSGGYIPGVSVGMTLARDEGHTYDTTIHRAQALGKQVVRVQPPYPSSILPETWRHEYVAGMAQEVYSLPVPPSLFGFTLKDAVLLLYRGPLPRSRPDARSRVRRVCSSLSGYFRSPSMPRDARVPAAEPVAPLEGGSMDVPVLFDKDGNPVQLKKHDSSIVLPCLNLIAALMPAPPIGLDADPPGAEDDDGAATERDHKASSAGLEGGPRRPWQRLYPYLRTEPIGWEPAVGRVQPRQSRPVPQLRCDLASQQVLGPGDRLFVVCSDAAVPQPWLKGGSMWDANLWAEVYPPEVWGTFDFEPSSGMWELRGAALDGTAGAVRADAGGDVGIEPTITAPPRLPVPSSDAVGAGGGGDIASVASTALTSFASNVAATMRHALGVGPAPEEAAVHEATNKDCNTTQSAAEDLAVRVLGDSDVAYGYVKTREADAEAEARARVTSTLAPSATSLPVIGEEQSESPAGVQTAAPVRPEDDTLPLVPPEVALPTQEATQSQVSALVRLMTSAAMMDEDDNLIYTEGGHGTGGAPQDSADAPPGGTASGQVQPSTGAEADGEGSDAPPQPTSPLVQQSPDRPYTEVQEALLDDVDEPVLPVVATVDDGDTPSSAPARQPLSSAEGGEAVPPAVPAQDADTEESAVIRRSLSESKAGEVTVGDLVGQQEPAADGSPTAVDSEAKDDQEPGVSREAQALRLMRQLLPDSIAMRRLQGAARAVMMSTGLDEQLHSINVLRRVDKAPPRDIAGHVIVAASEWVDDEDDDFHLFWHALRAHSDRPVVYMTPNLPQEWASSIPDDKNLFYLKGDPNKYKDWLRAHASTARRVVMLARKPSAATADTAAASPHEFNTVDSSNIFATLLMENRLASSVNPVLGIGTCTELMVNENIVFLRSAQQFRQADTETLARRGFIPAARDAQPSPPDAQEAEEAAHASKDAGEIPREDQEAMKRPAKRDSEGMAKQTTAAVVEDVLRSVDNSTLPQATAYGQDSKLLQNFVGSGAVDDADEGHAFKVSSRYAAGRLFASGALQSVVVSIFFSHNVIWLLHELAAGNRIRLQFHYIPTELFGVPYGALYEHCVEEEELTPVGLYRDGRHTANNLPYVQTNPRLDEFVREGDLLFVIAPKSKYPRGAAADALRLGS